jgi:hypothetical protein
MGFRVSKVDPSDMSEVAIYDGLFAGTILSLASDGTYLYAGKSSFKKEHGMVVKIDPSDMSEGAMWNEYGVDVISLACPPGYVLAGLGSDLAEVVRLDPATMTEIDRWTDGGSHYEVRALAFDDNYYYAAVDGGIIVIIDPTTMTTVDEISTIADIIGLIREGSFMYVGGAYGYLAKYDISTWDQLDLVPLSSWLSSISKASTLIYAGIFTDPGEVDQIGEAAAGFSKGYVLS